MKLRKLPFLILVLQIISAGYAHAEKADSEKQIDIEADNGCVVDQVKAINTCNGNVILTQGTLIMKGAKLVTKTSPDGWQFATLFAPGGAKATMRQKRDGGPDLWMEGEAANRITYDQKTGVATLYSDAKVRRLTGTKPTDESDGAYLSYDSNTEIVTGANSEDGISKPGLGRVKVTIQPRPHVDPKDAKDVKEVKDK